MFFLLLLILPGVRTQDPTPRPYNLPFNSVQFVQLKPAKKGPILFPNDSPPPPPTPLIVTSRPLAESIARSELNPNNSLAAQSRQYQVSYKPEYLARDKNYKPFTYTLATVTPVYDYGSSKLVYGDTANNNLQDSQKGIFYKDYEKRLMESIYKRRDNAMIIENAWDRPIQRRRFEQKPDEPNLRARITNLKDDVHLKQIKVLHGSLNSREANDYNDGGNDHDSDKDDENDIDFDVDKVNSDRSQEFKESIGRKSMYPSSETSNYNYGKRSPQRRVYSHYDNDRNIKARPTRSLNQFNANKRIKPIRTSTQSLFEMENQNPYMRYRESAEDLSDNDEKYGSFKNYPKRTAPRKNDRNLEIYPSYSLEVLRVRPVHSIENEGTSHDRILKQEPHQRVVQPLYELDDNADRDLNTPPKTDHFKYQDVSPQRYNYYKANDGEHENSKEYNHGENYAFSYTVKDQKTGDDFSHSQQSTGTATNGQYRVRLPDGRMQVVSYTADENGYKADVRYDEQHDQDNSIDVDVSKDHRYRNDDLSTTYKHNDVNTHNHRLDNQDSLENDEYLRPRYNNDKTLQNPVSTRLPTLNNNYYRPIKGIFVNPTKDFEHKNDYDYINDYGNKKVYQNDDGFQNYNKYDTKSAYVDGTNVNIDDHTNDRLSDNNNEYLEHYNDKLAESNDKVQRAKDADYLKFSDEVPLSKEIDDYSSELNVGYQPHTSKFSSFNNNQNTNAKLVPSYEELKDLFVTNANGRKNAALPVIVSTVRPNYDVTPDVVAITPKPNLYTNIRNIVPVTPTPYKYSTPSPTTPRSYLLSTIANLKHQISLGSKPVLSHHYINKINKYLTYK